MQNLPTLNRAAEYQLSEADVIFPRSEWLPVHIAERDLAELSHFAESDVNGFLDAIEAIERSDGHRWKYWSSSYENQLLDHGADCLKCGATAEYGPDLCPGDTAEQQGMTDRDFADLYDDGDLPF